MKIGLMGGTFNPIHNGHLIISEHIRDSIGLDKIIFIPSGNPPHKASDDLLRAEIRKDLTLLAILSNPKFSLSTIEIERAGKSYTIDTIRELKKQYSEDELYFIIGADSLFELNLWKDYEELLRITNFIVVDRPGANNSEIDTIIHNLQKNYGAIIKRVDIPLIEISSTDIRNRIKKGLSIKYLVPDKVEEFIINEGLYK